MSYDMGPIILVTPAKGPQTESWEYVPGGSGAYIPGTLAKPNAEHVIIMGAVFKWEEKAPFSVSGMSILGGLEYDKERDLIRCHECGGWFRSVGRHIGFIHKVKSKDYKSRHGLRYSAALVVPSIVASLCARKSRGFSDAERARSASTNKLRLSRNPERVRRSEELVNFRLRCRPQLTAMILKICQDLGRAPSLREFIEETSIGRKAVLRKFGVRAWIAVLEACDVPKPYGVKFSRDVLIELLRELHLRVGRLPRVADCSAGLLPSHMVFVRTFGSWDEALSEAGFGLLLEQSSRFPRFQGSHD